MVTENKTQVANGFSILELLIGLGILSVISITFITLMEQSQKSIKGLEIKLEQIDFMTAFKNQMATNATCASALSELEIPAAKLVVGSTIDLPLDKIKFQGQLLSTYKFSYFKDVIVKFNISSVPIAGSALGDISVGFNYKNAYSQNLTLKPMTTAIGLSVDGAGKIISCPLIAQNKPLPVTIKQSYRNKTSSTITCPPNTVMTGGGCDFDSNDKTPDVASRPSGNGWECRNPEPDNDHDVYVYAVCLPL